MAPSILSAQIVTAVFTLRSTPVEITPANPADVAGSIAGPVPTPTTPLPALSSLELLLGNVDGASYANLEFQDKLVGAKLGVASGLFTALRAKHAPTAHHCLRVALRCSVFARHLGLSPEKTNQLEVAALLHDVGKIGVPDQLLTKAGPLDDEQQVVMDRHRSFGNQILATCAADPDVLEIIRYSAVRYDGMRRSDLPLVENQIPIGARILAIIDAYDAMTTDHVYRRAMPRERALSELFHFAGAQFDPHLVREFASISADVESQVRDHDVNGWNHSGDSDIANSLWRLARPLGLGADRRSAESLFHLRLLDAMHDGVVCIDATGQIVLWNSGLERLTGVSAQSVLEKTWNCEFLELRDADGNAIRNQNCPLTTVLRTRAQATFRGSINPDSESLINVDILVIPVVDEKTKVCHGVTTLIRDISSETTLRERVQDLHEQATTDPLTGLSNRAEFDRGLNEAVESSLNEGGTVSVVIADIDRFKQVNDVYGHQAGDEVLTVFAKLLRRFSREEDLVARYGGEEFVVLCPDCDNAAATRRAEMVRRELAQLSHHCLDHQTVTASFGVTEIQLGDDSETMLRRADRALYQAKDGGRNRVVQLGAGLLLTDDNKERKWLDWMRRKPLDCLLERTLVANVPMNVLAEKIRGFIADHGAEIVSIEENQVVLSLDIQQMRQLRRSTDRPVALLIELLLSERPVDDDDSTGQAATLIEVRIRPRRARDRRAMAQPQAEQILASIRSYLIAQNL